MVFLYWELKFDKLLRYRINNGIKDASATSIYGSRGANGVILITTKTGKAGASYKLKLS
jgi:TonB-dependent SusC/RagA subfamily outer membrane receptor